MADSLKRAAEDDAPRRHEKRQKSQGPKKWRTERKDGPPIKLATIEAGDAVIIATCTRGKEGKAKAELYELLDSYVQELYPAAGSKAAQLDDDGSDRDIEADIHAEVTELKAPSEDQVLLLSVNTEMACVVFCKVKPPIEVTSLVHRICKDAQQNLRPQRSRFLKRLTPVTLIGKATENGLEEVAKSVLAPHFHQSDQPPRKFAIRPTIRNHSSLDRETVIQQVARAVGPMHSVDLKNYDLLILVDIWTSLCGMAVVEPEFEALKRYNVAELYNPTAPDAHAN